jgi:adenine-specific DNA methylase
MEEDRRLIEETLPIREISEESRMERNKRGHISAIHYWWARRPLVVSRAALFSSLVRIPNKTEEVNGLIKQMVELCKWESANNSRIIGEAKKRIFENFGHKPRVLDCFAGGGAIPVEALRLGCETAALELNPVAYIILLCTLVYPAKWGNFSQNREGLVRRKNSLAEDIEKWGRILLEMVENEIGELYPNDADGSCPIAYLWARTVKCPNPACQAEIPLIKQFSLSRKEEKQVALKPVVDHKNKRIEFMVVERRKLDFDPRKGTMKRGTVTCPVCGGTADAKYLKNEAVSGRMNQRMTCVVLYKKGVGKLYRIPTKKDLEIFESAKRRLQQLKELKVNGLSIVPDESIPYELANSALRARHYGFDQWGKLFNARQLLSIIMFGLKTREVFSKMLKETQDEEYTKVIVTYLALLVDRIADFNSMLCVLNPTGGRGVVHTFGRQTVPMVWDYAETNVFNPEAASWPTGLHMMTETVQEILLSEPAKVYQGTATMLPFTDAFFDAVVTDPPYYDNIQYAEISDFFYVWLKRFIGDQYPEVFSTPLTPKSMEIVSNPKRHGGKNEAKKFYEAEMTRAFKEIARVLKENGLLVVVFAHQSTSAWETLINSMIQAQFNVVASWPLHTERQGRLRAHESASLASSFFIVCRKHSKNEEAYFEDIQQQIADRIQHKLDAFWAQGIRGADFFISAIGPAIEVFGRYRKIKRLSGEEITVNALLEIVRQIVTDYSMRRILQESTLGIIDPPTRFYVLWRWAYNNNEIMFDDARKLAQALGAESDTLIGKIDLLQKKGDKVKLLGPKERGRVKDLGQSERGTLSSMIDVLHTACLLWEKGDIKNLKEFLSSTGFQETEAFWNVAQALSEILPEGDKERQLIQGLLASKASITVPTKKAKGQTTLTSFKEQD